MLGLLGPPNSFFLQGLFSQVPPQSCTEIKDSSSKVDLATLRTVGFLNHPPLFM